MAPAINKDKQRRLDEVFNALSVVADGAYIYLCDMESDISRWSKAAVDFFDLPGEYMKNAGGIWSEHVHPDDREQYDACIERIFVGSDNDFNMQYRARAANGEYVICSSKGIVIRNSNNKPIYFGGSLSNHGIHRYVDPVTGLRSLYGFFEDLKDVFIREDKSVVIMIGLSDFSRYNDVYGFLKGDQIIEYTADIITESVHTNKNGFVGHIGGDDFIAIVPYKDVDKLCQTIIAKFDSEISKFYNDKDKEEGYIEVANRKGVVEKFPLISISIAVVVADKGRFSNILEIGDSAAQVKHAVKAVAGSSYAIDRRKK